MNPKKSLYLAIIVFAMIQLAGCAWFKSKEGKTARELTEEGIT